VRRSQDAILQKTPIEVPGAPGKVSALAKAKTHAKYNQRSVPMRNGTSTILRKIRITLGTTTTISTISTNKTAIRIAVMGSSDK
jgi:hypothetical protein